MPILISFRLAAACALALVLSLSTVAVATAKKVSADLRVAAAGKVLTETTLDTGTTKIATNGRATCLGKGTGGSGRKVTVKGSTALGLLGQAAQSTKSLKPLLVTDHFLDEFGLGLCGVGGYAAKGKLSWYLKVNHRNPELGGDSVKLKGGDEVLWALTGYPYPKELSLEAPATATPGTAFEVTVYGYDDKGKRKPLAGAKLPGAAGPTDGKGHTSVTLTATTPLRATHGKDIPSNAVIVSVSTGGL